MASYSILQKFYNSKEWKSLRQYLIAIRGPICQHCGKLISRSIDIIAHHVIELTAENVNDPNIALNEDNVELVCFDCHSATHERYGYGEKKVYVVYGMPLAGKKTFVYQNMRRGDLVVEIDRLFQAVSGLSLYDKPDRLMSNVMPIHDLLIDQIATRKGRWLNAWVIGGFPNKTKRERLADKLDAELIYIECSKEEALQRLLIDPRKIYQDEYKSYIEKWIENYIA